MTTAPLPASEEAPRLAPPGAGVPGHQRMLGWVAVRVVSRVVPIGESVRRFRASADELIGLCPADASAARRVLVPPMRFLEDSSRYWSSAMVLEHLTIVGVGVTELLKELTAGRAVSTVTGTADVKPRGELTPAESIDAFGRMVDGFTAVVGDGDAVRRCTLTHPHPWFGPLRPRVWVSFMPVHHRVHLRQMRAILSGF